MLIRDLDIHDLVAFENYELPSLFNGPFKIAKAIGEKGKLLGLFWVRATVEPTLVLKKNLNKIQRARAIHYTVNFLKKEIPEKLGISDAFVIFEKEFDPEYIEFLKKHYHFEEVKALRIKA
jgi:hypothetical protein